MIPRLRPFIRIDNFKAMLFVSPSAIEEFEYKFAKKFNMKYALLLPLGRCALFFLFRALHLKGKKIILPAYNCRVVASAVIASRNIPHFIDCEENSFNIDLQQALFETDSDTAAMVVTSMYGYPVNPDALNNLKREKPHLILIGDNALSLFTLSDGCYISEYFDLSFFSFGLGKQMTTIDGGMALTNRQDIYNALKIFRDHFTILPSPQIRVKRMIAFIAASLLFRSSLYPLLYYFSEKTRILASLKGTEIGINELLPHEAMIMPSNFQASIGISQLGKYDENRNKRKKIIQNYFDQLIGKEKNRFELPPYLPVLSHFPVLSDYRDDLANYLFRNRIHATNVFREMPSDLPLIKKFCTNTFKNAQNITDRCLLLPLYAQLSEKRQNYIINTLLAWQPLQ